MLTDSPAAIGRTAAEHSAPRTPEPPPDPDTRLYVNRRHHFTMRVPLNWEQMGARFIERLIADKEQLERSGKASPLDRIQLESLRTILREDGATFRCEIHPEFNDCVEIIPYRFEKASIWHFSDEYIKSQFQLEAANQTIPCAVYDVHRIKVGGRDCLVVELSNDTRRSRSLTYTVFVDDHNKITFAVSARHATFARRKREFETAMKTLKFTK